MRGKKKTFYGESIKGFQEKKNYPKYVLLKIVEENKEKSL